MNAVRSQKIRARLAEYKRFCWVRSLFIFGFLAVLAIGAFANAGVATSWKDLNGKNFIVVSGGDDCSGGGFSLIEKSGRREITVGATIHFEQDTHKAVTVTSESVPGSCHYETELTGDTRKISSTTNATSCPDLPNDTVIESLAINKTGGLDYSIRRKEAGKADLVTSCVLKIGSRKN